MKLVICKCWLRFVSAEWNLQTTCIVLVTKTGKFQMCKIKKWNKKVFIDAILCPSLDFEKIEESKWKDFIFFQKLKVKVYNLFNAAKGGDLNLENKYSLQSICSLLPKNCYKFNLEKKWLIRIHLRLSQCSFELTSSCPTEDYPLFHNHFLKEAYQGLMSSKLT